MDDDESDIDGGENINPSLRILAPMESNNPATTESMQIDKTITRGSGIMSSKLKKPLQKRLGFEKQQNRLRRFQGLSFPFHYYRLFYENS